jgi:hypothetical protein
MNRTTRTALMGYGAFCAVNWAVTYYAARSGSPLLLGSTALLSLNESLRKLNLLSYVIDPLRVAQGSSAAAAPGAAGGAPVHFLPTPATVTQSAAGTTTTFGP